MAVAKVAAFKVIRDRSRDNRGGSIRSGYSGSF
jgi:hypothetical protein